MCQASAWQRFGIRQQLRQPPSVALARMMLEPTQHGAGHLLTTTPCDAAVSGYTAHPAAGGTGDLSSERPLICLSVYDMPQQLLRESRSTCNTARCRCVLIPQQPYHSFVMQVTYCTTVASLSVTLKQWLDRAPRQDEPTALQISLEEHAQTAHEIVTALQQLVSLGCAAPALQPSGAVCVPSASVAHDCIHTFTFWVSDAARTSRLSLS